MSPWRASKALDIERLRGLPVAGQRVEIVERKGTGHPDTICDEAMEAAATALAGEYRRRFGRLLHFNLDKAMLVAGKASPAWGGGRIDEPMRMVVGDRATRSHEGAEIPVGRVVEHAVRDWLGGHLRYVDPRSVVVQDEIKPGAAELSGLFSDAQPGANDTSAGAAYAPLSPTETATLGLERHINSPRFHADFPEAGEDVKVMLVRRRGRLDATVAVAFVDRHVPSVAGYVARKGQMQEAIEAALGHLAGWADGVSVALNTLDEPAKGMDGVYLTVSGTSAEAGDSGEVGRGNRPCGVIGVNRPMSAEAVPGKNMASHVGKVYNLLAQRVADRICAEERVAEAYVRFVSRIGAPLAEPHVASLQLRPGPGQAWRSTSAAARAIVLDELRGLPDFLRALERGTVA